MPYKDLKAPAGGKISIKNGKLNVPDNPVLPFIRGDGTGPDIWAASERVFDAAVQKAYGGRRKVVWFEVFAGEASKNICRKAPLLRVRSKITSDFGGSAVGPDARREEGASPTVGL